MRVVLCVAAMWFVATTSALGNPAENDEAMIKLATSSGCMTCHSVLPTPRRPDGLPPIAPAWRDIAVRYRDDPGASNRLTRIVVTGSNPNARHWTGKAGATTMPPNAVAVSEADARVLVNWILVLVP
jgi:cytochrome c